MAVNLGNTFEDAAAVYARNRWLASDDHPHILMVRDTDKMGVARFECFNDFIQREVLSTLRPTSRVNRHFLVGSVGRELEYTHYSFANRTLCMKARKALKNEGYVVYYMDPLSMDSSTGSGLAP